MSFPLLRIRQFRQRAIDASRRFARRWYCSCNTTDNLNTNLDNNQIEEERSPMPFQSVLDQFASVRDTDPQQAVSETSLRSQSQNKEKRKDSSALSSSEQSEEELSDESDSSDDENVSRSDSSHSQSFQLDHEGDVTLSNSTFQLDCENGLPHFAVIRKLKVEYSCSPGWEQTKPNRWEITRPLSWGGFGILNLAKIDQSNREFVVKTLPSRARPQEIDILKASQSRFIVKLYASFANKATRFICMEYCALGNLRQYIGNKNRRERFTEPVAATIAAYIYAAVKFLHKKEILHLDITPENVLITSQGYPILTGFGNACRFGEDHPNPKRMVMAYTSPELIAHQRPTKLADLWSAACVLYEILVGKSPFQGTDESETELRISLGFPPDVHTLSTEAGNFLVNELNLTVEKRPGSRGGISAILKREFFRKVNLRSVWKSNREEECEELYALWKMICGENRGENDGEDNTWVKSTAEGDKIDDKDEKPEDKFDINWRKWLGKD